MENALTQINNGRELAIMPVMDVYMAIERSKQITEFIKRIMVVGVDYGVIPGTGDKPALLKPGAEKLTTLFGLSKRFSILEKAEDWSGESHSGEPFFYYIYRCSLYRGDLLIAEADGSCNSHESKYRYRKASRVCPNCGQEAIIKGQAQYGGGWVCYAKKGGCGAKYVNGDVSIEGQTVGRVPNPDVADQANTILKMAQKRALVAATLLAVNGSEYFSTKEMPGRDEDDQIDGEIINGDSDKLGQGKKEVNGKKVVDEPMSVFWLTAKEAGLTKEAGRILNESGGDAVKALASLKTVIKPAVSGQPELMAVTQPVVYP